jgi:hypothetical protein
MRREWFGRRRVKWLSRRYVVNNLGVDHPPDESHTRTGDYVWHAKKCRLSFPQRFRRRACGSSQVVEKRRRKRAPYEVTAKSWIPKGDE